MHCAKDQPNAKETVMTPTSDTSAAASPHATILIAEDDGPSGLFLQTAFEDLGCHAVLETDGNAALARARAHCFDLLLLDCCMPGAGASRILSVLRADPQAASAAAPAVATSAELDAPAQRRLREEGFAGSLLKPVTLARLRTMVEPLLPGLESASELLDDAAAMHTSGTPEAVRALRGLFARDLCQLASELNRLADNPDELSKQLHRLLASCGFCGTPALADAARQLKRHLDARSAPSTDELERFRGALMRTLQALEE